jgi:hypothetical protein
MEYKIIVKNKAAEIPDFCLEKISLQHNCEEINLNNGSDS